MKSLQKILFTVILIFFLAVSCQNPILTLEASKKGILIWFEQILPALLPFTILSGILLRSSILTQLGRFVTPCAICLNLVCGFAFGFPIGAKLAGDFYRYGYIPKKNAYILAICSNNFGPIYVIAYALPLLFQKTALCQRLTLILYGIPLLFAVIFLIPGFFLKENASVYPQKISHKKPASRFQLNMEIIDAGIISGFESLIKICGYIVLFSILCSHAVNWITSNTVSTLLLLGNLEITNGITLLHAATGISQNTKALLAIQLLSLGGLSGLAQSASILSPSGLSVKVYGIGKLLLSLILTLVLGICLNINHG